MNPEFFRNNRQRLRRTLKKGIIALSAHSLVQRVNDMPYPFEQESNFFYLTGIVEPDWLLIMNCSTDEEWLIAPHVPELVRIFDGGLSASEATSISGVSTILSAPEGRKLLKKLGVSRQEVGVVMPPPSRAHDAFPNPSGARLATRLKRAGCTLKDIRLDLGRLRAIKSSAEIEALREAAAITMKAFERAKGQLPNLSTESQLQAEFDYTFLRSGSAHAYDPIVASGERACTLHYRANNQPFPKNGLVVIDIGAKYHGYCADVTRTYAIGTPTAREVAVHAAVERAHYEIIARLKPGLSVLEYSQAVDEIMQRELKLLGLLNIPSDYRRYFPHAISHGLGIDVHDSLAAPTHFKPGMVLTVEPGIYIPEEGIGVRIEDDIFITETGTLNLTASLPTSL